LVAALVAAFFVPGVSISAAEHDAQTFTVNCSRGQTIAKALELGDARKPLVLIIRGMCKENVVITRDRVTLQGDPPRVATVQAVNPKAHTIEVMATWIRIEGLTVSGGSNGIWTSGVSQLVVADSVIQNAGLNGIHLNYSYGQVGRSTIQNNGINGLMLYAAQAYVANSEITTNVSSGIQLNGNSTLDISGGTISANGASGIYAQRSDANIRGTHITGNGTDLTLIENLRRGVSGLQSTLEIRDSYIMNNTGRGIAAEIGSTLDVGSTVVSGNGHEGVFIYGGSSGHITGGTFSGNTLDGVSVGVNSTAQIVDGATIQNNAQNGIRLYAGSKLWMFNPITIGANAHYGLACNDGESSAANVALILFSPANGWGNGYCSGY
jgi:hypothetical protein